MTISEAIALLGVVSLIISSVLVYLASTRKRDVERLGTEVKVLQSHQERCDREMEEMRSKVLDLMVAITIAGKDNR